MSAEKIFFLLRNITLAYDEEETQLQLRTAERFSLARDEISAFRVLRKGIDARKKPRIKYVYTVEFTVAAPESFWQQHSGEPDLEIAARVCPQSFHKIAGQQRIVIVGSGPAGLFAALRLAEYGIAPLLLERGCRVIRRI